MLASYKRFTGAVALAVVASGLALLPLAPAQAAGSAGLVIKEVYGAGGNTGAVYNADFVELYNPQATAQATNGLTIQYRSAAGGVGGTQALPAGNVPAGGHYLVQMSGAGASGSALPTPDLVASPAIGMAAAGGQVILGTGNSFGSGNLAGAANVTDMVGASGSTSFETAASTAAASATQSLNRSATGADTDSNAADFSLAAPTPIAAGPAALSLTNPGAQSSTVGTAITPVNLAAAGGTTPYTFSATNLPDGLSITTAGVISGTPTTAGAPTVTVTVTDSASTPGTDSKSFVWTVNAAPTGVTAIKDIQGTGTSSPITGQTVSTQGVVTAAYPTGGINGFYLQTPGADTADASDAIFVYGGASGFGTYPAIGDSVDVTGTVAENFGLTELTGVTWTAHGSSLGAVTPKSVVPGTNCPLPGDTCDTTAALDTAREAAEGEAFQPTGNWTLTDVYDGGPAYTVGTNSSSNFGELGVAAESSTALIAPTELFDVQTQASELANRKKWNDAHRIIVDDGSSLNYTSAANTGKPVPWMTSSYVPRVGAAITFPAPAILISDFSQWRLLPSSQVVGQPSSTQPQLQQTRAANATPADVGGDLKLATFNVLNFFPTTGNEYAAMGGGNACTYFTDRAGNQITNNSCTPNGPRGAANTANLVRQRDKIVSAINTANADIVSLEELENSVQFGKDRDFAITELVNALNVGTPGKWAFAPSPAAADLPALAEQDVIRTGFIYQPARVSLVGASKVLVGSAPFGNAREPLAQAFKKAGSADSTAFAVVVNHFKSKGSGVNDGTGQGNANPDRIAQADALVGFANDFKAARGLTKVFLVGDFNAYSHEDPIDRLVAGGYTEVHSTTDANEETYNFDGQIGSLDHVLANAAALADVSGADVWPINGYESVYYEYSRYNYNITDLYAGGPFRSSDHSPEIVGIKVASEPATRDIQILGTNDFHGRIQNDTTSASAGAAVLAGAVKQLRAANPDTVFAAAGDLIGASTFESFIAKDKPTIDALNEAGLKVSAAGNHEFDQGYDDLVNRVMAPYNADSNPYGGASWKYIAANLRLKSDHSHALAPTFTKTFGTVKVGFVGAVTEHLPELVSPGGISQLDVTDIVTDVNASANDLKADGADVIVLLVHEGAAGTDCATMADNPASDFGSIIAGVNDKVDAIVSGHTHLAYNCSFPVAGWSDRPVKERPVVSAGQYGMALNKLVFTVDTATGQVQAKTQALLPLKVGTTGSTFNYPVDSATQTIVTNAVNNANVLGAQPLGKIGGAFYRAKLADGTTENRGGESTLGNLVAEVQRWSTRNPESGSAQIAFMNPGGLRADMVGDGTGAFPRTLTYKQAANVQPFANTLVNEKLTGSQIKTVLEQQWQPTGSSRPFLKLGISKGFKYTFDESKPVGSRITGMWLNGAPVVPATVYSVTVNSFLATGGDNFLELNNGASKQDTGKTDLQGMVDYMAAFGTDPDVVSVDSKQNSVGVTFPAIAPGSYKSGDHVVFDVSSWSMTGPGDVKDTELQVKLGDTTLGTAPVTSTLQTALPGFDNVGTASVDVVLPPNLPDGTATLTLVGATTGTEVPVTVVVEDGLADIQVLATNDFHGRIQNDSASAAAGAAVLSGAVKQLRAANPDTVFAAAGDLIGASTFESFIQKDKPTIDALNEAGLEVSAVGNHELDKGYDDLINRVMAAESADNPQGGANWKYIAANLKMKTTGDPAVPATFMKTMDGVDIGFVGAVTEDLPSLVSPAGIADLRVDPIVSSVNAATADLKAEGADVVVMLVHEGAPTTACATMNTGGGTWANIVNGVSDDIDAIVSGHTHLEYNCSFPVAGWSDRPVKERPVVSAGQYGANLNQLVFKVDRTTGKVQAKSQVILKLKSCTNATACTNYPADPATATIVADAVAQAEVLGAQKLGELGGAFNRAKLADGTTENRGGESTLGNLVAEVQRWATRSTESGSAQIAFMNPGGLRADMVGTGTGAFPRDLTYKQAAVVQPFANTLVNLDLTGAQIKTVLEQQWQRDASNNVPSRPFLRLGISKGFTYTYSQYDDPAKPGQKLGRITGMWLNGEPISPTATYSVTVNSFLASGGDNFRELANGTGKQDTGKVDLEAMVDYMAAATAPVIPDFTQRSVGVTFPADAPASYKPGDEVAFSASSLAFSTAADKKDPNVTVWLGNEPLRTTAVDNTIGTAVYDEYGTAPVTFVVPAGTPAGLTEFRLVGNQTGTEVPFKIEVAAAAPAATVSAGGDQTVAWGQAASIPVEVTGNGAVATGTVQLFEGTTAIGVPVTLVDGKATLPVGSLEPGAHTLRVEYSDGNYPDATDEVVVTVTKATPTVVASDVSLTYGKAATVIVKVGPSTATGTVKVLAGSKVLGTATVSGGVAKVTLPARSLKPGTTTLIAAYSGNSRFNARTDTFRASVAKAASSTKVTASPGKATVKKTKVTLRITVKGQPGVAPTGKVTVKIPGQGTKRLTLRNGQATLKLAKFSSTGRKTIRVTYPGNTFLKASVDTVVVRVVKK